MSSNSLNPPDNENTPAPSTSDPPKARRSGESASERGKGFLEERPGHKSAMRAMSFIALLSAIAFGVVTLTQPEVSTEGIYITFGFLLAAFAPKTFQKFAERVIAT